jgi:hypothetical protein
MFPSGVAKNFVGTGLAPNTGKNHLLVLSTVARTIHDLTAGATSLCMLVGRSAPMARTVRACIEGFLLRKELESHLAGGTPVGKERSWVYLGVGRSSKMPLDDVGPKRGEGIGRGRLIL